MGSIDTELRRALGEPPADPFAKERALVRLRIHVTESAGREETSSRRTKRLTRSGLALLVVAIAVIGLLGRSLGQPPAARAAGRLGEANVEWAASFGVPPITLTQWGVFANVRVGGDGPPYSLVVTSSISLENAEGGTLVRTEAILDRSFYSSQDRANWIARGSPDLPAIGSVSSEPVNADYDPADIPTDPDELRAALGNDAIIGYLPDQGQVFEIIGSLLAEPGLSAAQRLALFEVVGSLDGVELLGEVQDPLQRVGVGFSYQVGSQHQVLIFDGDSGQPLAFEEYSPVDPTQLIQWQAFDPPDQPATDP